MEDNKPETESKRYQREELIDGKRHITFDDSLDNPVNKQLKESREWAEKNFGPQKQF
jgi:hypothetical protein